MIVRKMANLARLELSDAEAELFETQIEGVLEYVKLLEQVDVSGVLPLAHPHADLIEGTPLRDDVVVPSPVDSQGQPKTLTHAPEVFDGGFKVPPIL